MTIIKYTLAGDAEKKELSFESQSSSIEEGIARLIETFDKQFNPANIDVLSVSINGIDLGDEGVYDAEIALAQYYS